MCKSIAIWPASLGLPDNKSEDTHATWDKAASVVRLLKRDGYGGEGKIFPLEAYVEPE